MSFSIVINHTPWRDERCVSLAQMLTGLKIPREVPTYIHAADYRATPWQYGGKLQWMREQWEWSAKQNTTHHIFMTDDLHIAPRFWEVLGVMVPEWLDKPVSLLCNHPQSVRIYEHGHHWYKTNSWLVGPCYVLPHDFLIRFLSWFHTMPPGDGYTPGTQSYENDDSNLNLFISATGGYTLHPLPTIIEHRDDLVSTVGHGDKYSRERLSWRESRYVEALEEGGFRWRKRPLVGNVDELIEQMCWPDFWANPDSAPMLAVGGE